MSRGISNLALLTLIAVAASLSGCSMAELRMRSDPMWVSTVPYITEDMEESFEEGGLDPTYVADDPEPQFQDRMGEIEDFLSRTEQYTHSEGRPAFGAEPAPARTPEQAALEVIEGFGGGFPGQSPPPQPPQRMERSTSPDPQFGFDPPIPYRRLALTNTQVDLGAELLAGRPLGGPALPVVQRVSIRTRLPGESDQGNPVIDSTSNVSMTLGGYERSTSLGELLADMKYRAASTSDMDTQIAASLIQLAFDRPQDAGEISPNLSVDARKIITALVDAVLAVRTAASHPDLIDAALLERVEGIRHVLADMADPIIPAIILCNRVVTFGVYEETAANELVAGRNNQTIVYAEVDNFTSEYVGVEGYRTLLASKIEVLTAAGETVWVRDEPEIMDLSRRRRRDFFLAQLITLPAELAPGEYVLKVYIEDKLSGRASEATKRFQLLSPASITQSPP